MKKILSAILIAMLIIGILPIGADTRVLKSEEIERIYLKRELEDLSAYEQEKLPPPPYKMAYAGDGVIIVEYPQGTVFYDVSGKRLGPKEPNTFYPYDKMRIYDSNRFYKKDVAMFNMEDYNKKLTLFTDRTGKTLFTKALNFEESNQMFPYFFSEGFSPMKSGNTYKGYIDRTGELAIDLNGYKELRPFINGYAPVSKDGEKWGYIDTKGNLVIDFQFDSAGYFSEGMAAVAKNEQTRHGVFKKVGFIDESGTLKIPFQYDIYPPDLSDIYSYREPKVMFSEGLCPVAKVFDDNGVYTGAYKWGYINKEGDVVIDFLYDNAFGFSEGLGAVAIQRENKEKPGASKVTEYGFIDKTGKVVIPFKYSIPSSVSWKFKDGIITAGIANKDAEQNGYRYIFLTKNGEELDVSVLIDEITVGRNDVNSVLFDLSDMIDGFAQGYATIKFGYDDNHMKNVFKGTYFIIRNTFTDTAKPVPKLGDFDKIIKDTLAGKESGSSEGDSNSVVVTKEEAIYNPMQLRVDTIDLRDLQVYNIGGRSYFKLRDVAKLLSKTQKRFSVDYDNQKKLISIQTNRDYIADGSELKLGDRKSKKALSSTVGIEIDGREIFIKAYNINGNNYFNLRELADALNFKVEYDEIERKILINSK